MGKHYLSARIDLMKTVTLISDFGIKDHYAALLKGAMLSLNPSLNLVDVSHQVDTHDIRQAAYFLKATYKKFPKGTIHVVAVNNFYTTDYEMICFEHKEQFFIGPNNGIFSLTFDTVEEALIYKIVLDEDQRDLFSLIAHGVDLISKGLSITEVGPPLNHYEKKLAVQPVVTDNEIRATIVHIDKYENLVLNVHREFYEHISRGRDVEIYFKFHSPIKKIQNNYSDVPIGEVVCLFNAANYLEISINMGKAASQLDLNKDETIPIRFV